MPMPAAKPIAVARTPIGERLGGDREHDLAARRPDRPHQRRLAGALGDEDRERVVDAEGGDDDGDAGERQQHRLEEAEEVALDVVLLLGGQLGAGDRLDPVRQRGRDPCFEVRGNGPSSARTRTAVIDSAPPASSCCAVSVSKAT